MSTSNDVKFSICQRWNSDALSAQSIKNFWGESLNILKCIPPGGNDHPPFRGFSYFEYGSEHVIDNSPLRMIPNAINSIDKQNRLSNDC